MATEAVSLPPSAAERCQAAGPCPDEEGMDVPRKCHESEGESAAPAILQETEPGGPEPTHQDEAPASRQSPVSSGEEGSQFDRHDAVLAPPAQPDPADASGWVACRGDGNSGDLLGDPPSIVSSLEPPRGSDAICHPSPREPKLSAVTEQGCQESAEAASVQMGDGSPATSSGAEQPAKELANDPWLAGEQGHPVLGSAGGQGSEDASYPPGPDDMLVPGMPSPVPGDLAACSQQGAAGARPAGAMPRSPVATGDSSGPAHLACDSCWAPGGGEGQGEGSAGSAAGGEGDKNKSRGEVGAGAVQESEPREVPPGDTWPQGSLPGEPDGAGEPGRTEDPGGAADPAGADEPADTRDLTGASDPEEIEDPASARETASTPDPAGEDPAGSRDPTAAEAPTSAGDPASTVDLAGEEPAGTSNLGSATDSAGARDPAGVKDPGAASERKGEIMENGDPSSDSDASPAASQEALQPGGETPIEREIRLHQEREEMLRRQRGLASPRVTLEYVEVRMKPILSQAQAPAQLPKEKERQWAGAQMQREIQREARREDDLVQQGKVRGAYDRGTPQELQDKKMLFEQQPGSEPPSPRKPVRVTHSNSPVSPLAQGPRGATFTEASCRANVVIQDSSTLLRPSPGHQPSSAQGNAFFSLRPKRPQSRLEQEVLEAQERERELQRQRQSLYGWTLPWDTQGTADGKETPSSQPERPSCGKLEVTWPPPALVESPQQNGLDQAQRNPRSLRQKSALIQQWESGAICNHENQE